jgi:hypothetical protein
VLLKVAVELPTVAIEVAAIPAQLVFFPVDVRCPGADCGSVAGDLVPARAVFDIVAQFLPRGSQFAGILSEVFAVAV